MEKKNNVINDLVNYKNLKIVQNPLYFSFSLDSVLLPNFANITEKTKKIIDIGTGNAPIPLILSTKCSDDTIIIGVEIQKEIYDLACEGLKINNLENRITLINDDIIEYSKTLETDSFDLVLSNPPYFKLEERSLLNNNDIKSKARHEVILSFDDLCKASKKLLKNGSSFVFVHRSERLCELISILRSNNLEPKRIRFVYPKSKSMSNMVLVDAVKNGKTGLKVLEPLVVHDDNGNYTDEVIEMFS